MSDYPKRGEMSEDGKFYTHTDGSVHDLGHPKDHVSACKGCSLVSACYETYLEKGRLCGQRGPYQKIEGAYVPTDDEQDACDMARRAINACISVRGARCDSLPGACVFWKKGDCVLRNYLYSKHQPDAWEVKP